MAIAENTPHRLVLKSGSTTLTFDRESAQATLQRKLVFWKLRPAQTPFSEITDVTGDMAVDRASGVEVWQTMLVMRTGEAWAFPATDKQDAETNANAVREFLKLSA